MKKKTLRIKASLVRSGPRELILVLAGVPKAMDEAARILDKCFLTTKGGKRE